MRTGRLVRACWCSDQGDFTHTNCCGKTKGSKTRSPKMLRIAKSLLFLLRPFEIFSLPFLFHTNESTLKTKGNFIVSIIIIIPSTSRKENKPEITFVEGRKDTADSHLSSTFFSGLPIRRTFLLLWAIVVNTKRKKERDSLFDGGCKTFRIKRRKKGKRKMKKGPRSSLSIHKNVFSLFFFKMSVKLVPF